MNTFRPGRRHAVALSALAACSAAFAQPRTEDPTAAADRIVITGSKIVDSFGEKSGIPLSRMPQSVQLIDADEITTSGAQSVGELLRGVPSANPGNSRVARYQSFSLKVRGFLADQMRNGMRQRYYEDVDASALANVERIEVLKGPSSVLYGQSALGGILSIITKRPEKTFGASGALVLGSRDQRVASVDVTGPLTGDGRLTARLTAEVERSGTFVDLQDMDRHNAALALRWEAAPGVALHFLGETVHRRTLGNPGLPVIGTVLPNGVAPIARSRYLGEPALRDLTADAPLAQLWADIDLGGGWTLSPRLQHQGFDTAFSQIRVREMQSDGVTLNRNGRFGAEDDTYRIAQLDLQGKVKTGRVTHQLLMGVEASTEYGTFHQDNLANVGSINVLDPVYTYPAATPQTVFAFDFLGDAKGRALYLQDLIALTPQWDLIVGLRRSTFDYRQVFNASEDRSKLGATTWQLGTNWRLAPAWTLYGGLNTGFDTENVFGARGANGQPFKPERSDQLEAGVRYAVGTTRVSAALFQVRRTDALTTDPVDPDFSVQTGEQRVRGFELEGQMQPLPGWQLSGGYAWLQGRVTQSNDGDQGTILADTPRHTLTLRSSLALGGAWTLRAGAYATSSRLVTNGSAITLPKYALLDLGLGWRGGKASVDLSLNNALDQRYFTASGNAFAVYPGDPRQLSLRVGYAL